jgi:hypothetical protein
LALFDTPLLLAIFFKKFDFQATLDDLVRSKNTREFATKDTTNPDSLFTKTIRLANDTLDLVLHIQE